MPKVKQRWIAEETLFRDIPLTAKLRKKEDFSQAGKQVFLIDGDLQFN